MSRGDLTPAERRVLKVLLQVERAPGDRGRMSAVDTWLVQGASSAMARACWRAAQKGKEVIYVPFFWWGIMTIIKSIPERIFKKLSI